MNCQATCAVCKINSKITLESISAEVSRFHNLPKPSVIVVTDIVLKMLRKHLPVRFDINSFYGVPVLSEPTAAQVVKKCEELSKKGYDAAGFVLIGNTVVRLNLALDVFTLRN